MRVSVKGDGGGSSWAGLAGSPGATRTNRCRYMRGAQPLPEPKVRTCGRKRAARLEHVDSQGHESFPLHRDQIVVAIMRQLKFP
jgi:hypothetical protein